jgi:hypothetical protein
MPPRFRSFAVLAVMLLSLWFLFLKDQRPFESGQHAVDALKDVVGDLQIPEVQKPPVEDNQVVEVVEKPPPPWEHDISTPKVTPVAVKPPEASFDSSWSLWRPSIVDSVPATLATGTVDSETEKFAAGTNDEATTTNNTADPQVGLQEEFEDENDKLEQWVPLLLKITIFH